MNNADLKKEFFKVAKKIKEVCKHQSISTCMNGKCPFSTANGNNIGVFDSCAFDWCNFGKPHDWEFDNELFANLTDEKQI